MEHTLKLPSGDFTIKISPFGLERYYYNARLVKKIWSLRMQGVRKIDIDGQTLTFDFKCTYRNYWSRAYINGELVADDLFPDLRTHFDRIKNRQKPNHQQRAGIRVKRIAILTLLWALLCYGFFLYFSK